MQHGFEFILGVDGGGSGTRVRLQDAKGHTLAQGHAGPSGLALGVVQAWLAISAAMDQAFVQAQRPRPPNLRLAVGLGVAGAHHAGWLQAFRARQPHFGLLVVDTDATTSLLGAHAGQPGAVLAVGTGSVGAALLPGGQRRDVGGWGFPSGDEGSGAWLGLRALAHTQQVADGRRPDGALARAVLAHCGGSAAALRAWLAQADQTRCASLAPLVLAQAGQDAAASALLQRAGQHLDRLAQALDPGQHLPLALTGGLAGPLRPYLQPGLQGRARQPLGDAADGALLLVRRALNPLDAPGAPSTTSLFPAPQATP